MDSILEQNDASKSEAMHTELEELKSGFATLRDDVMNIVSHAMGFGRHGAQVARDSATEHYESLKSKFEDFKQHGGEKFEALEKQVTEHPMSAALIAFGVGFVFAKLMHRRN